MTISDNHPSPAGRSCQDRDGDRVQEARRHGGTQRELAKMLPTPRGLPCSAPGRLSGITAPQLWTMPARAAVVSHLCVPAEMSIKVPAHAPRHCTWDGRMPMPYRRPCPRHAALCYPTPCPCPCLPFSLHSIISWPVRPCGGLRRRRKTVPGPRLGARVHAVCGT